MEASGDPGAPTTAEAKIAAALERLGQVQRVLLQQASTAHGLSPVQARILARLAASPDRGNFPAELAEELGVTRATVADALAALVRKNLIDRQITVADRRRAAVSLTVAGRDLVASLDGWAAPLETELAALPERDQGALLATLLHLIAGLQRAGAVSTSQMCVTCFFFRPDTHPGQAAPHHCNLLDAPLAERELRFDCPEHQESA